MTTPDRTARRRRPAGALPIVDDLDQALDRIAAAPDRAAALREVGVCRRLLACLRSDLRDRQTAAVEARIRRPVREA